MFKEHFYYQGLATLFAILFGSIVGAILLIMGRARFEPLTIVFSKAPEKPWLVDTQRQYGNRSVVPFAQEANLILKYQSLYHKGWITSDEYTRVEQVIQTNQNTKRL